MREKRGNELKQLEGDFSKSQLGLTKVRAGFVPRSDERNTRSANEINRELKPGDTTVKSRRMLRPRQLGPIPLDGFNSVPIRLSVEIERNRTQ
jgi:hypothetical protein